MLRYAVLCYACSMRWPLRKCRDKGKGILVSRGGLYVFKTECTQPILTPVPQIMHFKVSDCHSVLVKVQFDCLFFKKKKCCASLTIQSNTVSLLLSLKQMMTPKSAVFSLIFQLKPATWFSLKPMVCSKGRWRLVTLYFFFFLLCYPLLSICLSDDTPSENLCGESLHRPFSP